jgi:hypothetical protein
MSYDDDQDLPMSHRSKELDLIAPLSSVNAYVPRQGEQGDSSLILTVFEERRDMNSHVFVMYILLH